MKLIFDTDMFKAALKKFDLDTKKMPLGKLSKTQIARGERMFTNYMVINKDTIVLEEVRVSVF